MMNAATNLSYSALLKKAAGMAEFSVLSPAERILVCLSSKL